MTTIVIMEVALKTSLVLATAWGVSRLMSRSTAAGRHLVWATALTASVVVLATTTAGPRFGVPLLPAEPAAPVLLSEAVAPLSEASAPSVVRQSLVAIESGSDRAPTVLLASGTQAFMNRSWATLIAALWAAGAFLLLMRLGAGITLVGRMALRSVAVADGPVRTTLEEAMQKLRIARPVGLRESDEISVPMMGGIRNPSIFLPQGWQTWSPERLHLVLLHELAHVCRRDVLSLTLARVASALLWFNPLAHLAVARMKREQEQACDDLVLTAGANATSYADALVDIARSFCAPAFPAWAAPSMARPSQLAGRVDAILDTRRVRPVASTRRGLLVGALTCALVLPLGALEVTPADRAEGETPQVAVSIPPVEAPSAAAPSLMTVVVRRVISETPEAPAAPSVMAQARDGVPVAAAQDADVAEREARRQRVADALINALQDKNADVREQALNGLIGIGDERAIPGLLTALRGGEVSERRRAVAGLAQFDTDEALDGLIEALSDDSPEVRGEAARALGRVARGGPRVTFPLGFDGRLPEGLLRDREFDIRIETQVREVAEAARQAATVARERAHVDALRGLTEGLAQLEALRSQLSPEDLEARREQMEAAMEALRERIEENRHQSRPDPQSGPTQNSPAPTR